VKRAPFIALMVLIAAALVWWFALRTDTAVPVPQRGMLSTGSEVVAPAKAQVASGSQAVVEDKAAIVRQQAPSTPVGRAPVSGEAVFRGRCVDANGTALAGVTVKVRGWVANRQRLEEYRREHGEVEWEDPDAMRTDVDGRFEIGFVPPPPFQFVLDLEHPEFASVGGRWSKIEPGENKDFGDVVMPQGAVVAGRVVDVDGVPQADVEVRLNRYNRQDRWRTEIHPTESGQARTKADGTFRIADLLAPAIWNLDLGDLPLAEPLEEVAIVLPTTTIDLVVKRTVDRQSIRGIVVDDTGKPVRSARIDPVGRSGGGRITSSNRDGTFELKRRDDGDPDGGFVLQVDRDGYEYLTTEQRFDWGAQNVRLVLQPGIDVHVAVVRDDDSTPVEQFALRVFPKPGSVMRYSSRDGEVRGGWEHEGGRAVARGQRRGPQMIVVEPRADSGLARSELLEIMIRDGVPPSIEVRLATLRQQSVLVVHADGSAAQGSTVELLEPSPDATVTASSRAVAPTDYDWLSEGTVTSVDEAKTDAFGKCTVGGAGQRPYSLRVTGAAHAAWIRSGVVLSDEPIECVLPEAAALRVTIRPLELLGDLREQAKLPRTGEIAKGSRAMGPGIRLQRKVGDRIEQMPAQGLQRVLFDEEGVAVIGGVPEGTWDLLLVSSWAFEDRGYTTSSEIVRSGVLLREGEQATVALDMPEARCGRLFGTVLVAGELFEGGLQLRGEVGVMPNGDPRIAYRNAVTNAQGTFEVLLPPGTWRVGPWVKLGESGLTAWASQVVRVTPGEKVQATFDARIATAKLRVLGPDGKAVVGVQLQMNRAGEPLDSHCAPTDDDGRTSVMTTPGMAVPIVLRRSLTDPASMQEFYRQNSEDPTMVQRMFVELPPILFAEQATPELEVRLPAEWDQ
jgi:hypothetical protein